jgi:nucleotide-binding universal stress UspA family protein
LSGTILCDVTDPTGGRSAAEFAQALAARLRLRVVLVFVLDGLAAAAPESVTGRQRRSGAERALAATADKLDAVETRLAVGDHAEALARVAAEEGADLIILGSRRVGFGRQNLRCGPVRDLEAATPIPVLVAPPSTRKHSGRRLALAAVAGTR